MFPRPGPFRARGRVHATFSPILLKGNLTVTVGRGRGVQNSCVCYWGPLWERWDYICGDRPERSSVPAEFPWPTNLEVKKEGRLDRAIDPFFAAVQDYLAAFLSFGTYSRSEL